MDAVPVGSLSDLLACVAAFGRSLDEAFDPQRFLAEFSARVQRLVPHDRVIIVRREEDGHTCSVFAAYAVRGTLIGNPSHYTTAFSRGDRLAPAELLLTEVFEGNAQVVSDMAEDSRFREHPFGVKIIEAGLRARCPCRSMQAGASPGHSLSRVRPPDSTPRPIRPCAGRSLTSLVLSSRRWWCCTASAGAGSA